MKLEGHRPYKQDLSQKKIFYVKHCIFSQNVAFQWHCKPWKISAGQVYHSAKEMGGAQKLQVYVGWVRESHLRVLLFPDFSASYVLGMSLWASSTSKPLPPPHHSSVPSFLLPSYSPSPSLFFLSSFWSFLLSHCSSPALSSFPPPSPSLPSVIPFSLLLLLHFCKTKDWSLPTPG